MEWISGRISSKILPRWILYRPLACAEGCNGTANSSNVRLVHEHKFIRVPEVWTSRWNGSVVGSKEYST